jgi:hypothetical protein
MLDTSIPFGVTVGGTGATTASGARTNLGVAIGTNVQAWSAVLDTVTGGTYTGASSIVTVGTIGTGTWQGSAVGVLYGGTGATTASGARTNLGVAIGSNVEAWSAVLDAVAGGTYTGAASITTLGTIATGTWHATKIGLLYGGTNADLSSTGGTSQVLKQVSSGAAITVGQLAASDLSNTTTGSGAVVLQTSGSLITPAILDSNSANLLLFATSSTAVNYFSMQNASTGNTPALLALGSDANITSAFLGKGTGGVIVGSQGATTVPLILQVGSNTFSLSATLTGSRTLTLPDANVTLVSGTMATAGANANITSMTGLSGSLRQPTAIQDTAGYNLLAFTYSGGTPTDYFTISNGTANGGVLQITSSNTDASWSLLAKGGGGIVIGSLGASTTPVAISANGGFTFSFSMAPTANRVLTFPDASVTLVAGTMAPTASPTFTGTPAAPTAAAATNTTQIATTAFVTSAARLGAWDASSYTTGTAYLAATDGFVVAYSTNTSGTNVILTGLTDASNPPTTTRLISTQVTTGGVHGTLTMPVIKGNYWKVTIANGNAVVQWIPIGN